MNNIVPGHDQLKGLTAYKKYEVDVKGCAVEVCEPVTPETIIGWHYESGQPVTAGLYGQVATIYYNPMRDSLLIMCCS